MRVQYKLFIITLLASLTLVTIMLLLAQWSFDRGLLEHVNQRALQQYQTLSHKLESHYEKEGSWKTINQSENQSSFSMNTAKGEYLWLQFQQDSGIDVEPRMLERARQKARAESNAVMGKESSNEFRRERRRPFSYQGRGHDRHNQERRAPEHRKPEHRNFRNFDRPEPPAPRPKNPPPRKKPEPLALIDSNKNLVIGFLPKPEHRQVINLHAYKNKAGEKVIGYLVYANRERLLDDYELNLSSQLSQNLWWIAALMILLSASLALPFSHLLLRPLRPIVSAIHTLAKGEFPVQLKVETEDEIGRVANDVNNLTQKLEQTDQSRKTWLANISHELRTPLAVMRGELEAMLDGIRDMNKENLTSAHQEALHLQRLVEDLYQLTSSELGSDDVASMSYQKEEINFLDLLEDDLDRFQPLFTKAGLEFQFNDQVHRAGSLNSEVDAWIMGDAGRISQLLHNLINNSIKYTHAPGKVVAELEIKNNVIIFNLSDSAPSVKKTELEKIFDHLYRAEQSRNRKTGGSGLGLAICKKIAESHGGQLTAQLSELGGIKMTLCLPLHH